MKCKFCNEEMPERGNFCPICGGDNSFEPEAVYIDPDDLVMEVEELVEEEGEAEILVTPDMSEETEEMHFEPSPKLKKARLTSAIFGCVAALTVLALVLFAGIKGSFSEDGKGWDIGSWFSWLMPRENNVYYKDSYTVTDKKVAKNRDKVVATIPGAELTNGQLQIFYWTQVYDFLNNNSYYLSYYGLDYTSPLDGQNAYDGSGTWQQYFLEGALEMWHSNAAFAQMAKKNGFRLEPEYQAQLDSMRADMEKDALKYGFASADAMLQDSMGALCTLDDYLAYMETYYLGYCYFAKLYDDATPTMEEIEAYFEDNAEYLANQGITKDSGYTVDIRHILIEIEELKAADGAKAPIYKDEEEDSEGETDGGEDEEKIDGYTQAAWDACLAEANRVLDLWLAGEKTENSFAELAKEHSADGNAADGGIYTGVEKGDMVESFDEWCFEVVRQEGDYGIVRTKYGYHIMYFVSKEDIWVTQTRSQMLSEASQQIVKDALAAYPMEVVYKKIVLGEVDLAS